MTVKRRLIRRKPVEEEIEEEEVEDEDLEVEEEEDEEVEEEEDEEEEPAPVKKSSRGIAPKPTPAPAPKPAPKAAPKPTKKVVEEEEEEEEEPAPSKKVKVQKVEQTVASAILLEAVQHLEDGKTLVISNLGNGKFGVSYSEEIQTAASNKLRGKSYYDTVTSDEHKAWSTEWKQKSYEEKVKFAKKKGIKWDAQPNPRVDVIHLTEAVRLALGIEKYKPEYRSRSARAALRG
jgi:hypothetical protein